MAEVQNSQQSGEMTRRFIEFVLMQAQQIALMLGQIPGPDGKPMEPNLPIARIFIDQLEMIREKTRGNLTKEEEDVLTKVLADLQLAFVEAGHAAPPAPTTAEAPREAPKATAGPTATEDDSKKKFTKSYG
jgi:ABC-type Fe3+ transport system substrate-binding protein